MNSPRYERSPCEAGLRQKAVLICPTCGHESGTGGDWMISTDDGRIVYVCPECDTEIASRFRD